MKKQKQLQKQPLKLDRETLRCLTKQQLRDIAAGVRAFSEASNADVCCA